MSTEPDSELVVAKLAARIRDLYCRARSRYCVHQYDPGEKYDKDWEKIAKWCVAFGIDPREFIEVQFHAMKPYPYIKHITTDSAIKRFFDSRKEHAAEIANAVLIQMAALEKLMGIGRTARELLTDSHQEFDPLFKYVVSRNYELDDLASLFWDDALAVYLTSIYYDGIYQELITDELKQAAGKVRGYANG